MPKNYFHPPQEKTPHVHYKDKSVCVNEIITVYSENHVKHMHCGQNSEIVHVQVNGKGKVLYLDTFLLLAISHCLASYKQI
jgi:hypothetical protein